MMTDRIFTTVWRGLATVAVGVMLSAIFASGAGAGSIVEPRSQFRLLSLDGSVVKWGALRLGAGAIVTVALAQHQVRSVGATNCRLMDRFDRLAQAMNVPRATVERELDAALRTWERAANIRFEYIDDAAVADIVIGTQVTGRGRAFANVSPREKAGTTHQSVVKAMAEQRVRSTRRRGLEQMPTVVAIEKALVCFNVESDWKIGFDGNLKRYDLRHTLMHEIGHAIGLDHPGVRDELMDFRYRETFAGLQPGDVQGVVRLYGPVPTIK